MKKQKYNYKNWNPADEARTSAVTIDRYTYSDTKTDCPECGETNRWRTYRDTLLESSVGAYTEDGVSYYFGHVPDRFGVCDRVESCGHSLNPFTEGWEPNTDFVPETATPKTETEDRRYFIPSAIWKPYFKRSKKTNNLYKYLCRVFGKKTAKAAFKRFNIGTCSITNKHGRSVQGATVFLSQDSEGVHSGEVLLFDPVTGATVKSKNYVSGRAKTWLHTQIAFDLSLTFEDLKLIKTATEKPPNVPFWLWNYQRQKSKNRVLFGLPQLEYCTEAEIVEAKRTAVFMWCTDPVKYEKTAWLATSSMQYMTPDRVSDISVPTTINPDGNGVWSWRGSRKLDKGMCWGAFVKQQRGTLPLKLGKGCKPKTLKKLGLGSGSDLEDVWKVRNGIR